MKKFFLLFNLSSVLFFMGSCTDNDLVQEDHHLNNLQTKSSVQIGSNYYVNDKGALCFNKSDDFFQLSDSLIKLSYQELKDWEQRINFKSYRTLSDEIIHTLYEKEGSPDFNSTLQKYSNIIYLDNDSTPRPIISEQVYRNVTNADGVFYVGDVKHAFINGKIHAFNSKGILISDIQTRAAGDVLVQYPTMRYNPGGKKRVDTYAKFYEVATTGVDGKKTTCLYMDIEVRGYSKNIFGTYKKYETDCYIDDVTVRFPGYNDIVYSGTRSSNGNCLVFTNSFSLTTINVNIVPPFPKPLCLHYRARTGGTGNYGMAYNFYKGVFFNVKDATVTNPGCDKHDLVTYNK